MTKVDQSKGEMMSAQKVGVLAVIANEQGAELINPGETAFTGETLLVDGRVEKTLTPAFDGFAVALVLTDIGNDLMIEANLARVPRIKSAVGIEIGSGKRQAQAFQALESGL